MQKKLQGKFIHRRKPFVFFVYCFIYRFYNRNLSERRSRDLWRFQPLLSQAFKIMLNTNKLLTDSEKSLKIFLKNSNDTLTNSARQTLFKQRSAQLRQQKLFNDHFANSWYIYICVVVVIIINIVSRNDVTAFLHTDTGDEKHIVGYWVFLKLRLKKFVKLVKLAKNFNHWSKLWWDLNPGTRIIGLMLYQISHWVFCTTCASSNHQFHVLPCMNGFVKLS